MKTLNRNVNVILIIHPLPLKNVPVTLCINVFKTKKSVTTHKRSANVLKYFTRTKRN